MDEIIKTIADKTGIGVDDVKKVVDEVMAAIKERGPELLAGLTGDGEGGGGIGDTLKGALGGLLGNKD